MEVCHRTILCTHTNRNVDTHGGESGPHWPFHRPQKAAWWLIWEKTSTFHVCLKGKCELFGPRREATLITFAFISATAKWPRPLHIGDGRDGGFFQIQSLKALPNHKAMFSQGPFFSNPLIRHIFLCKVFILSQPTIWNIKELELFLVTFSYRLIYCYCFFFYCPLLMQEKPQTFAYPHPLCVFGLCRKRTSWIFWSNVN